MKYKKICTGRFVERPNRFTAYVEMGGIVHKVHVKNTGRCRELLVPGAEVFMEDFDGRMRQRKLRYSLIGVKKNGSERDILVNMDSQAPNKVVEEALLSGRILPAGLRDAAFVKREYKYRDSRLDFYIKDSAGKEAVIEVKGVTLEEAGIAKFPDAPTERGVRHIMELIKAREEGYVTCIIFVIQMEGIKVFTPNYETHSRFGEALCAAEKAGVEIMAYDCIVGEDSLSIHESVCVQL